VVSQFLVFQIAAVCGLVGMTLGWRGVMTKYAGFYDLPTAWNQVFWGILLGGAYASYADNSLFIPYYEAAVLDSGNGELNIIQFLLVPLLGTIGMHLLLRRQRVRKGGSQATSGWALGLAVGGMLAIVLIQRKLATEMDQIWDYITILSLAFFAPRVEGLITTFHGTLMLKGKRWGAILRTTFWRTLSLTMFYFAWFNPLAWVFIIPPVLLVKDNAEKWVWDSVPKEGKRRWRRMQADKVREANAAKQNQNEKPPQGTVFFDPVASNDEQE